MCLSLHWPFKILFFLSVKCPTGSREVNGECVACEVGTYQNKEGQGNCLTCPQGTTTESIGAKTVDLCQLSDTEGTYMM